ncbi:MAG TPA: type II toxin-antitoxin system VapC family toxin [Candidatus Deferrimicrobiaceae bacterium]|nr:type II toxin-antitoxin system VapC family toxin [Candidatus Deferrimicrobiaceae bacterium]
MGGMRVLLDTHVLLWWLFDDLGLSASARALIADPGNAVLVSSASAWEIATKRRLGKLPEAEEAVENLPRLLREARIEFMPITVEHALAAGALPGPHRDPFDRMLIAQSRIENLPVVTADPVFAQYSVPVLW